MKVQSLVVFRIMLITRTMIYQIQPWNAWTVQTIFLSGKKYSFEYDQGIWVNLILR
jgi:hypothetical protein